jgi:hypothetical protein
MPGQSTPDQARLKSVNLLGKPRVWRQPWHSDNDVSAKLAVCHRNNSQTSSDASYTFKPIVAPPTFMDAV